MLILNVWYLNITIKNTFFLLFGVGLYLRITVEQLAYVPAAGACTCFCGRQAYGTRLGVSTRQGVGGWRDISTLWQFQASARGQGRRAETASLTGEGTGGKVERWCGADPEAPLSEWSLLSPLAAARCQPMAFGVLELAATHLGKEEVRRWINFVSLL